MTHNLVVALNKKIAVKNKHDKGFDLINKRQN